MPDYTSKLNLPKPLGTENVTRAAHNELVDAIDAGAQKEIYKGTTAPTTPVDNDLWLDTSVTPNVLKRYDLTTTSWVKVTSTAASEITQDANNRFVTDAEKADWNARETPMGAQAKVDTSIFNHEAAVDPHSQYAKDTDLSAHTANTNNPHGVTAAQIGALAASVYTASDVLTKLLTVDGPGSGINADLFDSKESTAFSNAISTGSTSDPNTTQEAYILTNHTNSPSSASYWHIRTFFYSSLTGNKAQMALRYNGTTDEMYIRSYYSSTGWTSWKRVWHEGNFDPASKLDATAKAADSSKLNGATESTVSTANTIAKRDSAGDINARLFRSEYDATNANIGYIMTQVDTASNNYIRPSTLAQVKTALGIGWVKLAEYEVSSSAIEDIIFDNIPTGYSLYALKFSAASNYGNTTDLYIYINDSSPGITSGYRYRTIILQSTYSTDVADTSQTKWVLKNAIGSFIPSIGEIVFTYDANYIIARGYSMDSNQYPMIFGGRVGNTPPLTKIQLTLLNGDYVIGSKFTLLGLI